MLRTDQKAELREAIAAARRDLVTSPQPGIVKPALEHAHHLATVCDDPELLTELGIVLAQHYNNFGNTALAQEWLQKSRAWAGSNVESIAWVTYTQAGMLLNERKADEVLELLAPYHSTDVVTDKRLNARIQTMRACALDSIGLVDDAEQAFKTAILLREELNDEVGLATVYYNFGEFCMRRDDDVRALEYFQKTRAIELKKRNNVGLAQTCCHLAMLHAKNGERDQAMEAYKQAQDCALAAGVPMVVAMVKANGAELYGQLKNKTAQLASLLDAKTYLDRHRFDSIRGQVLGNLASVYVDNNELDKALPLLDEALEISRKEGHKYAQGYWLYTKGRLLNMKGKFAEAIPLLTEARDCLASVQAHVYTLHAFAELARAQAGLGITNDAFKTMSEWATVYVEQHTEGLQARMRRLQRLREQEKLDHDKEVFRLRSVELAAANEKLAQVNARLEETNKTVLLANKELVDLASEKDEFMTIAAHDLRNPLSDMRSMLQTVINHYDLIGRDDVFDVCRDLLSTVTRMEATIHSFLEISRSDKRTSGLNIDKVDLVRFAHRAAERHFARADSKDISIQVLAATASVWAWGDPSIIDAVLDNLVSNAVKYSPYNSVVTIHAQHSNGYPEVKVCDEGPGVSSQDRSKLFTKYSRIGNRPTGGEESIGLGLYLAKRMSERMKGTIEYADQPGGGAAFTLRMQPVD